MFFAAGLVMLMAASCTRGGSTAAETENDSIEVVTDSVDADSLVEVVDTIAPDSI